MAFLGLRSPGDLGFGICGSRSPTLGPLHRGLQLPRRPLLPSPSVLLQLLVFILPNVAISWCCYIYH